MFLLNVIVFIGIFLYSSEATAIDPEFHDKIKVTRTAATTARNGTTMAPSTTTSTSTTKINASTTNFYLDSIPTIGPSTMMVNGTETNPDTATVTSALPTITEVSETCKSHEWQCADGTCVAKCDGTLHCSDGSDETMDLCEYQKRPILALIMYCVVEGDASYAGVCPDICHSQPEYCYYALGAANGETGMCHLPSFPNNGTYRIEKIENRRGVEDSRSGPADFSIHYYCYPGSAVVGNDIVRCVNGSWINAFPRCEDACQLPRNTNYTYTCIRGAKNFTCGDYVAIGTHVEVRKDQYRKQADTGPVAYTSCNNDRTFNLSTNCIHEVETRQAEFNTTCLNAMSSYENEFKTRTEGTYEFDQSVRHFQEFEKYLDGNATEIKKQVETCEIYLHLKEISLEQRTDKNTKATFKTPK